MFAVASHESLVGGCLPRARPQLTWSRRSLDQVDLRLALFPQASPPNAHRGINEAYLKRVIFFDLLKNIAIIILLLKKCFATDLNLYAR
ncbi:hypothetical protein HLI_20040 [Halobacillus litoralis]|uniref:Uncharacterized protein n=1 Tax=Halobacillus litoralis TaxID=45668 RepID=A0A410MI67_9BACI|nr:hypothetical protein HLI_20040 [Halobacillus litoralis]